jgi:hypothetical protein
MALIDGEILAGVLDLDYAEDEAVFDQVAQAADDVIASLITTTAYDDDKPACREAAVAVAVEMFQARTAAGGQAVAVDMTPGPYRLSVWLTRRVMSLLGPYLNAAGMVG